MLGNLTKLIGNAAHLGKGHKEENKLNQTLFELRSPHGSGDQLHWAWQPAAKGAALLAVGGGDSRVTICSNDGSTRDTLKIKGPCRELEWSRDGSALAVLNTVAPIVCIYDGVKGKKKEVIAAFADPLTCMAWSKTSLLLTCGSQAGNVLMYNHASGKSGCLEGKHKAAITSCAWSPDGQLAICAEDQSLSLSHENGQTFAELRVRLKPSHLSYGRADNGKDSLLTLLLDSKAVFVLNVS